MDQPPEEGSLPLENPDHEAFCTAVAIDHTTYTAAYRAHVQRDGTDDYTYSSASALARKLHTRLEWFRRKAAKTVTEALGVSAITLARYHQRVMETPVEDLPEGSDLAQEVTRRRRVDADGIEWETVRIKMAGKDGAARALAELAGFNAAVKSETTVKHDNTTDDMLATPTAMHTFGVLLQNYPEAVRHMMNGLEGRDFGEDGDLISSEKV